jgi:hypothetical protein
MTRAELIVLLTTPRLILPNVVFGKPKRGVLSALKNSVHWR